jgi:YidC/Oxa1 family membrane protein insertase
LTLFRNALTMLTNMIDYLRYALYLVLIVIMMAIYQMWDKEHPQTTAVTLPEAQTVAKDYIPAVTENTAATSSTTSPAAAPAIVGSAGQLIHVTTDDMEVAIDTQGGNITEVKLLKYPEELHSSSPFVFLNNSESKKFIAQSGLLSSAGPDTSKGQAVYQTDKTNYSMSPGQDQLQVNLTWQGNDGVVINKTFTFKRNDYEIGVAYQIANKSKQAWQGNLYLQLLRKNTPPPSAKGFVSLTTYFGAAVSSPEKPFNKITFKQMQDNPYSQNIVGGWAAMVQHYFVSAWIPNKDVTSQYFSKVTNDGLYTIGMIGPGLSAAPGDTVTTQAKFYAGPSIAEKLENAAPGLQLTIDYGWFWFISIAIFWMMQKIHMVVGNWGWSIVLVTMVIKLMFYHFSAKIYRSMSVMKKLQPRIEQMKQRYGEDKQKFTQEMMNLYRKEKVNPMSGCLPILVQIPVFIALYWVLIESVQLREAPFILWIQDLTLKDPYYVLPVMMGISMFLQQRLNPPAPDPMQAKIMMMMPIVFTAMFLNFPAGLMLYWFVNNTLSFLQQWYIMHTINNGGGKPVRKKR